MIAKLYVDLNSWCNTELLSKLSSAFINSIPIVFFIYILNSSIMKNVEFKPGIIGPFLFVALRLV